MSAARKLTSKPTLQSIIDAANKDIPGDKVARNASIYLSHKYSGARLKEIGEQFGVKESAVSQASSRFAGYLDKDKELRELVESVRKGLGL